jgi:hypothetical protein
MTTWIRRSRILSALAIGLLVTSVVGPAPAVQAQEATECRDWVEPFVADPRFKVWACKGDDPDKAMADRDSVATLVAGTWDLMITNASVSMGPPLPDGVGTHVDREHGGDPRVDVYALLPGQGVFRGSKLQHIKSSSAAAAGVSLLDASARGGRPFGASGYVLVDRSRLGDATAFRQDLIHEFFHVLQYAHNGYAPFRDPSHWFVEASATWAETYYWREDSDAAHGWFDDFQKLDTGLEDPDVTHRYAAYVWPFFMEQEDGPEAVIDAWAAMDTLDPSSDYDAVTDVIDDQLPFGSRFRDFAVRNLNNDALAETDPAETLYGDLDPDFHDGVPPGHISSGSVAPGAPYVQQLSIPPLGARYADVSIDEGARWVTISVTGMSPESAVDGDAIVHVTDGWWERRPLEGGILRFCRDEDEPYNDIDEAYVVVSNHDRHETVTGPLEVSARAGCAEDEIVLEGTIHGTRTEQNNQGNYFDTSSNYELTMQVTITLSEHDWTVAGTASVSGEFIGNCTWEDSDSGEFSSDMRNTVPPDFSDMVASVQVDSSDPRFLERPIPGLYLLPSARTAGEGGTCGHSFGYVEDPSPPLRVAVSSCELEVFNDEGTWHGDCHEVSPDTAYYTGGPQWETHWTANLEQVSPDPD